jgi:hypothetical protein
VSKRQWSTPVIFSLSFLGLLLATAIVGRAKSEGYMSVPPLLTHQGGAATNVVIEGNLAYVSFGPELQILDVTNPAMPLLQGHLLFSDAINHIALNAGYLYLLLGAKLHVVDVRNPTLPIELPMPGVSSGITHFIIDQERLYTTRPDRFLILDIADPSHIVEMGSLSYPYPDGERVFAVVDSTAYVRLAYYSEYGPLFYGWAVDVSDPTNPVDIGSLPFHGSQAVISGDYLYFIGLMGDYGYKNDLHIADISDPGAPSIITTFETVHGAIDLNVINNLVYLMDGYRLRIIDTSSLNNLQEVGSYGELEPAWDTAVAANHIYIASGKHGLRIIRATNPANPFLLATYDAGGTADHIATLGQYAYIFGEDQRRIWDVTEPAQPIQLGSSETISPVYDVAIAGTMAAIVDGDLRLFDVSDPLNPSQTAVYETPGIAYGVALSNSQVYIADGALRIIHSQSLTEIGSYEWKWSLDIAIAGNYAYTAETDGIRISDISNPEQPLVVGFYPTGFGLMQQVKVMGNSLFAIITNPDWASSTMLILDITNPITPIAVGVYDSPSVIKPITLAGDYAYLPDWGQGMQVVQVTNPANPTLVGTFDVWGAEIQDVAVQGNYAYVASGSEGLRVVDTSNPMSPTLLSHNINLGAKSLVINGNYAYVAGGQGRGFSIVDISEPINTAVVGSYHTADYNDARSVAVVGNYAYVVYGYGYDGLGIFNISNPANPTVVTFWNGDGVFEDIAIKGNYAFIADHYQGLRIVNIANPANPVEVGFYEVWGDTFGVKVVGNYAYLANGEAGLRIVNVANPANPTAVSVYDTPGMAQDVVIVGNYAYVSDGLGGLQIVNISNPANPTGVGQYDTTGDAKNTAVAGNYAYVADGYEGLRLIEITNPAAPVEIGAIGDLNVIQHVAVAGSYAYLAAARDGLAVLDLSDPTNPVEIGNKQLTGAIDDPVQFITLSGEYAYLSSWRTLWIVDISNPHQPLEVAYLYDAYSPITNLTANHNLLFSTHRYCDGIKDCFRIWDISNPTNPTILSQYSYRGSYNNGGVLLDNVAYLVGTDLEIVDLIDPATPILLGTITGFSACDLLLKDNYIYVTDINYNRLHILDISDPMQPIEVGVYESENRLDDCAIAQKGHYILVSPYIFEQAMVSVIDVSDPTQPTEVSTVRLSGNDVTDLTLAGNFVYVTVLSWSGSSNGGIDILDLWNSSQPAIARLYEAAGNPLDTAVTNNTLYAAYGQNGWYAWPAFASRVTTAVTPAQGGSLIYTDSDGLEISVQIPPAAVTATGELALYALPYDYWMGETAVIGQQFDLSFAHDDIEQPDYTFLRPITIRLRYPDSEAAILTDESALVLQWGNEGSWAEASTTCDPAITPTLDTTTNTFTASICRLNRFALVGPTEQMILPVVFQR